MSRPPPTRMDRSTSAVPFIELWGQLVVPLQGEISDSQMEDVRVRVLHHIAQRGAEGLVIDVSGVWLMDSHLCAILGQLAVAARLMGTQPVLCGLSPEVVLTLQAMGIELEGIETALGLEEALAKLGLRLEDDAPGAEPTNDDVESGRSVDG